MFATFSKTITEVDIDLFAGVSGDTNALHLDEEFAKTTPFKGRIVHGFLTASFLSAAIANKLPGPGTIYLSQTMRFVGPVRPGDTVDAEVKVKELIAGKSRTVLTTTCRVGGSVVVEGEAVVKTTSSVRRAVGTL